jgi:hypothetical protein
MAFTPSWVLGSTCGTITNKFIIGDVPLQGYANSFSKNLVESYEDATSGKLMSITEEMMNFLVTLDGDDAILINNAYIFNVVSFDESGAKRKMKTLFKSALTAQKKEISIDEVLKKFKSFVFKLRSDRTLLAPKGWKISDVADIGWLIKIHEKRVKITDSF